MDPYIDLTVSTSQLRTSVEPPMTLASCQRHVQWLLVLPLVQGFKLFPSQCVNASGCNATEDGFYILQEFSVDDPTDLITVVDLPNRRMLQCKARHLVPVDTKWCPENQVSEFGQFFICITACLFLYLLMLYFCNLQKAPDDTFAVAVIFGQYGFAPTCIPQYGNLRREHQ
eukprot:s5434_g3.t1